MKYRCPYCGEKTFSLFNKIYTDRFGHRYRYVELFHLVCRHCGNEAKFKSTPKAKGRYKIIYLLLFVFFVLFIPVYFLWQKESNFFWMTLVILFIILFFLLLLMLIHTHIRHDVFVRKGEYSDELVSAKILFHKKHNFTDENIYILKPLNLDLHKVDILPRYIVAITLCESDECIYNVRFIKPDNYKTLVTSLAKFILYDDEIECGNGEFLYS